MSDDLSLAEQARSLAEEHLLDELAVCGQCGNQFGRGVLLGQRVPRYCGRDCRTAAKLQGKPDQPPEIITPNRGWGYYLQQAGDRLGTDSADVEDAIISHSGREVTGDIIPRWDAGYIEYDPGAIVTLGDGRDALVMRAAGRFVYELWLLTPEGGDQS